MKRLQIASLAASLLTTYSLCGADEPADVKVSPEAIQMYSAFLDEYLGKTRHANLGQRTTPMLEQELHDYSECISNTHFMMPGDNSPQWLTGSVLDNRRNIRFIDADKWQARDPQDSIRAGKKIAESVSEGFKAGLLEVSDIAFDDKHRTALFFYSFSCGRLCGNGGPVFFDYTSHGWKRREVNCGGWIA